MTKYGVDKALRRVVLDQGPRDAFRKEPERFLEECDLTDQERKALLEFDYGTLYKLGAHPFLLNGYTAKLWPGDMRTYRDTYCETIEPYGYPDWGT
ncbi:MAG: LigA protein [Chloroflexi bacterium]|nr:LigA protein [Chloroflexota bacterium]